MADEGLTYGACRERLSRLVLDIDEAQAATPVPATPEWTVHDVIAHQVGVVTDVNNGNLDGMGSDPWTAAQVASRRDVPMAKLIAEWEDGAPQFEAGLTVLGGPLAALAVADVWNHEQDIRGTLRIEGGRDPVAEHLSIAGYCGMKTGAVAEAGLAPLRLRAGVDEWVVGDGTPETTVIAEPYELARFICFRRTADQVRAYMWDGDPEPYVALFTGDGPSEPLPT
jgi:uncharacterized protein (TIGR03083 family)